MKGICAVCGRSVQAHVPKGGDGSALFPIRHPVDKANPRGPGCTGIALPVVAEHL